MKDLNLNGHVVHVNDDGLISLTDMWKASGQKNEHRPNLFVRTDKVKEFVKALESKAQKCALTVSKGGKHPGTWGHKLLAYKYASWIDPVFEVGAYTVLDKYFSGDLVSKEDFMRDLHEFTLDERYSRKLGSYHAKGLCQRKQELTELQKRHKKLLDDIQIQLNFK